MATEDKSRPVAFRYRLLQKRPKTHIWCDTCKAGVAKQATFAVELQASGKGLGTLTVHSCPRCGDQW